MFGILLFLFCVVPLLELWLLFVLAAHTSPGFTFLLVVMTGVIGAWLARVQGFRTLRRIELELSMQRVPAAALVDGVMILAAGLLLLTPGMLTDVVGFSLLIPPLRTLFRESLIRYFRDRIQVEAMRFEQHATNQEIDGRGSRIIDIEVVESSREQTADDPPSH